MKRFSGLLWINIRLDSMLMLLHVYRYRSTKCSFACRYGLINAICLVYIATVVYKVVLLTYFTDGYLH